MSPAELREQLLDLADTTYREFHLRTCPFAEHLIGVRMPAQRRLAKTIIKSGNYWTFLDEIDPYYYEELLITGIVIASAPMSPDERFGYIQRFLPKINNWAICDSFCSSFKIKPPEQSAYWNFLMQFQNSDQEFTLRFLFVMILDHFLLTEYLPQIFQLLDNIKSDQYYVHMAKAWLIAELCIKFRDKTFDYLQHDLIPPVTHNKAIQKACESYRISDEDKAHLRSLKL